MPRSVFLRPHHLSPSNWASSTSGKAAFIKLYVQSCGQSEALAPDWTKLENDFEGSATVVVAEVDCTADSEDGRQQAAGPLRGERRAC